MKITVINCLLFFLLYAPSLFAQNEQKVWHGIQREIHYQPDGEDFVLVNGSRRFNRALYGGNTAFRAEGGDRPEFALYLPGMGGNLKFGLLSSDSSKWMIDAKKIETRYRPGSMIYKIEDPLLQSGWLTITALAPIEREALIVKVEGHNIPAGVRLLAAYGGATGTRFSRDGDIGADPESSFYLKPEYCKGNRYRITKNAFTLYYGSGSLSEEERYEIQYRPKTDSAKPPVTLKTMSGIFPPASVLTLSDAAKQTSPHEFLLSKDSATPAVTTAVDFESKPLYFFIQNGGGENDLNYTGLADIFDKAEADRKQLAGRIKISTPDAYINTLGGALAVAADAVWEAPSFMHGAVAWRMRLNGWRGAYLADALGWHDRGRSHFSSYALSQVTAPVSGPVVMDTALHLARAAEKMGTSLFSSGYISRNPGGDLRPHHYDMNLVFIDQLLNHFLWTGDTGYVKKMWPLLVRHLDWENRNFDVDGDHLYDAYAAIWASDALQYSGGGVTHSSAYNYKAFKMAADLAPLIGENGEPYRRQAAAILKAINTKLWMPAAGVYAEYKDLLGNRLLHPSPAVWTIYHAIDSHVPDPFQAYQSLRYIDMHIPRIPVSVKGLEDTTLYTISTTNWQPYTWSLNNVVLGEVMHTALAFWQGGRADEAFKLWKGSLVESMYLGASPGNLQQLSFYDAVRGELYRDFADDIGMTARSLVEGLFGIFVDALHDTLHVTPGFPSAWAHASITTPDFDFSFKSMNSKDVYYLVPHLSKQLHAAVSLPAKRDDVKSVMVNGKPVRWDVDSSAIGIPKLILLLPRSDFFTIEIEWTGRPLKKMAAKSSYAKREIIKLAATDAAILKVYDPQNSLQNVGHTGKEVTALVRGDETDKTFFVQVKEGKFIYWQPVNFKATRPVEITVTKKGTLPGLVLKNNTALPVSGKLSVNDNSLKTVTIPSHSIYVFPVSADKFMAGTNAIGYKWKGGSTTQYLIDWEVANSLLTYDKIDLSSYFNDEVGNIFQNQYLSPRPKGPTMQLPTQGIGNWAYPFVQPAISDSGLRLKAGVKNEFTIAQGIPFATPSAAGKKNILFTSQWDNYPRSATVPLQGKAAHVYLLMAGSTNPMQSRMVNGEVVIQYKDGTEEKLELKNPENWWPVEQDYYEDGFAFTTNAPKPVRVYFKTGEATRTFKDFTSLKGFSNRAIDGGAGTVLDLPLNPSKELKAVILKAIANDVVIGLMSITLVR